MSASTSDLPSMIDPTRAATLLVAVQRHHEGAFAELVLLCEPLVRRHATRSAWRRNDVDDLVQESNGTWAG